MAAPPGGAFIALTIGAVIVGLEYVVGLPAVVLVVGLALVAVAVPVLFVAGVAYRRSQGEGFLRSVRASACLVVRALVDGF